MFGLIISREDKCIKHLQELLYYDELSNVTYIEIHEINVCSLFDIKLHKHMNEI